MNKKKTIVLNFDMKKDLKLLKKIFNKYENPEFYLILDEKLIYLAAEILISNGWLGESTTESLKEVLLKNLKALRKLWIKSSQKAYPGIKVKELDGNIRDILENEIKNENVSKIVIMLKKGFNPYWSILKPVIEELENKYKIEIVIAR